MQSHRYADVFGNDSKRGALSLVYAALTPAQYLDNQGQVITHPFDKPGTGTRFSISTAISECEIRAAKYLSESIAVNTRTSAVLASDVVTHHRRDFSYVSFGLPSNYKSMELLNDTANEFVQLAQDRFVSRRSGKTLIAASTRIDYGLLIKIIPAHLPERVWICCGGFGEWGTSGSAWYLARNWGLLRKKFRNRPFAVIVSVEPGRDESAIPVVAAANATEIESYVR